MIRSIIYKYIIHSDLHKPMSHNVGYVKLASKNQVVNHCNDNRLQKQWNTEFRDASADARSSNGANGATRNTSQNRKRGGAPRLPGERKRNRLRSPKSPYGTMLCMRGVGYIRAKNFCGVLA